MSTTKKHWYVADPIHQMLEFGDYETHVRNLVGSASFQRLRRIAQLGLASYVFPGAVHTRFVHSLGAAHLAKQVVSILGDDVSPQDARTVVCAALLHDIGHGPFSHAFERTLKPLFRNRPKHEDWTRAIILSEMYAPLQQADVSPERVAEVISPGEEGGDVPRYVRQIISSQLDVDRMDYLPRDAHFTGVAAGRVDIQYLVRCLRVIEHGSQRTLGLSSKGIPCYEAFSIGRHIMNRTVYYHKRVATFESMMEECLRLLVKGPTSTYVPDFLRELGCKVSQGDNKSTLISSLFDSYLRLTEDQIWTAFAEARSAPGRLGELSRRLLERRPVPSFRIAPGKHTLLEEELHQSKFTDEQFSIRPLSSVLYKQDSGEQVFVRPEGAKGGAIHISEASSLVDSLRDRSDTEAILVVFDESVAEQIEKLARTAYCLQDPLNRPSSPPSNRPSLARTTGLAEADKKAG